MTQTQYWRRNATAFIGAQALSLLGNIIVQHSIIWHITLTSKSGIYATLSVVCNVLPALMLAPLAGIWADRYNQKTLIVLANAAIAGSTLLVACVLWAGHQSMVLLFALLIVRSFGGAVLTPLINTMLPTIIPPNHLTRANGIYASLQSLSTLAAPVLAGAILRTASLYTIFFIDVFLAGCAIVTMLAFLRLGHTPGRQKETTRNNRRDMKAGLTYIASHQYLRHLLAISAVYFVLTTPVIYLTPLQVTRNYGGEVWLLSRMESIFSFGMLLGGVGISVLRGFPNRMHTIAFTRCIMATLTLAFVLPISFNQYLIVMGIFGFVMPFSSTHLTVLLQEKVEPRYRGRVFSMVSMISSGCTSLGMLAFGPLADVVHVEWLLLITGTGMLALALCLFKDKSLIAAGERA